MDCPIKELAVRIERASMAGDAEEMAALYAIPCAIYCGDDLRVLTCPRDLRTVMARACASLAALGTRRVTCRVLDVAWRPRAGTLAALRWTFRDAAGRAVATTEARYVCCQVGDDWQVIVAEYPADAPFADALRPGPTRSEYN